MSINLGDLLNIFKTHFSMNDLENDVVLQNIRFCPFCWCKI